MNGSGDERHPSICYVTLLVLFTKRLAMNATWIREYMIKACARKDK